MSSSFVSRRRKPFFDLMSAMLRIARGNPPRTEFLQRGLQLMASWSQCDWILFRIDGDIGFRCSAGLRRDRDGFVALPQAPEPEGNDRADCPRARGKDLLAALQESRGQGGRMDGSFSARGTFWTNAAGPLLSRHGDLLNQCFHGSFTGGSAIAEDEGSPTAASSSLVFDSSVTGERPGTIGSSGKHRTMDDCEALAVVCRNIGESTSLCMLVGWKDPGLPDRGLVKFLEHGAEGFFSAYEHWWLAWSLEERVKELTCLHAIASLMSSSDMTLQTFLQKAVEIIPEALLHKDVAAAKITLDGREVAGPGFSAGKQKLSAGIVIGGQERGVIEATYTVRMPSMDEGPFLKEERKLLDAIAGELSLQIERKLYQEEKRRVSEQLRHSNRLAVIGQLAAAVAHELNEPLTSILGFSQLAAKAPHLPEQVSKDLDRIVAISLHTREIVRKLLMYGGKMPERRSAVNINATVRDVLNLFGRLMVREGMELKLNLTEKIFEIIGDAGQLRQVVSNLVLNAVQAMPQGGTLTIATGSAPGEVSLVVADTGCGMSAEVREKIFIPFFTTRSPSHGTGLGLSVVHEIVSGLGGSIQVESAPGAGSSFTVRLPVSRVLSPRGQRKTRRR